MRRKGRVDHNQAELTKALRQYPGISIAVTSALGHGFPDLVVSKRGSFQNFLFELKNPKAAAADKVLTPDEEKFKAAWHGHYAVVDTLDEILIILGIK